MQIFRSLPLSRDDALAQGPILRREAIHDHIVADQILVEARAQAEQITLEAAQQATRLQEQAALQARAQVWQQAEALLKELKRRKKKNFRLVTLVAEQVVHDALTQLLTTLPDAQKVSALIRQLINKKMEATEGILLCHPKWLVIASTQLQLSSSTWSICADPQLAEDTICLRSRQAELHLKWSDFTQGALLKTHNTGMATAPCLMSYELFSTA